MVAYDEKEKVRFLLFYLRIVHYLGSLSHLPSKARKIDPPLIPPYPLPAPPSPPRPHHLLTHIHPRQLLHILLSFPLLPIRPLDKSHTPHKT